MSIRLILASFFICVTLARAEHAEPAAAPARKLDGAELTCLPGDTEEAELVAILGRSLHPYVRSLQRKVSFYHYGWRTLHYPKGAPAGEYDDSVAVPSASASDDFQGPVALRPPLVEKGTAKDLAEGYFRVKANGYFESTRPSGEYGSGLYAAADPLDSLDYSGKNGLLMRIGIPAGVKYLDLRGVGKNIPLSGQEARRLQCAIRAACADDGCRKQAVERWQTMKRQNEFDFNLKDDLLHAAATSKLLKAAFRAEKVGFIAGNWGEYQFPECRLNAARTRMTDAIFSDPDLAPRLDLALLVPRLEEDAPAEKKRVYEEVLSYFDAFDFDHPEGTRFGDPYAPKREALRAKYWEYYRAWAPELRQLPSGADLTAYQRERSRRDRRELTRQLYGCSPEHPEGFTPPARRPAE